MVAAAAAFVLLVASTLNVAGSLAKPGTAAKAPSRLASPPPATKATSTVPASDAELAADLIFARYLAEGGGELGTRALWKHLGKKTKGWGPQHTDPSGVQFVEAAGAPVPLRVWLAGDEGFVQVTIRAVGGSREAELTWDGKKMGSAVVAAADGWKTIGFPIPEDGRTSGDHKLGLRFKKAPGPASTPPADMKPARGTLALVSRFALRAVAGAPTPVAPKPDTGDALYLLPGERVTWLLPVPANATLRFDNVAAATGSKGAAPAVTLSLGADGKAEAETTHRGAKGASVRLSHLAGDVARISLRADPAAAGPVAVRRPRIEAHRPAWRTVKKGTTPKHVALVIIDSLPTKHLRHLTPGARPETPVLDRLAREGTTFTDFTAAGVYSKPTAATIWTGLYPATHRGHSKKSTLPKGHPLIQQLFRDAGFAALGLSANGYASDPLGYRKGWDTWKHYLIHDTGPFKGEKMFREALEWVDSRGAGKSPDRLFMVMFPTDPHLPYRPPAPLATKYYGKEYTGRLNPNNTGILAERIKSTGHRLKPADWDYYKALYYGSVEYADQVLGNFVDGLAKRGMLDDTLLLVTADHGEEFLEHGSVGHGHALYDEIIRIPLVVRHPASIPAGKVVRTPVEQADLAPTMLGLAGLKESPSIQGASLADVIAGPEPLVPRPAFARFSTIASAARTGRYKLIRFYGRGGKIHLYDVSVDPGETLNLAGERPIALRYATNLLAHWEAVQTTVRKARDGVIGGVTP